MNNYNITGSYILYHLLCTVVCVMSLVNIVTFYPGQPFINTANHKWVRND